MNDSLRPLGALPPLKLSHSAGFQYIQYPPSPANGRCAKVIRFLQAPFAGTCSLTFLAFVPTR